MSSLVTLADDANRQARQTGWRRLDVHVAQGDLLPDLIDAVLGAPDEAIPMPVYVFFTGRSSRPDRCPRGYRAIQDEQALRKTHRRYFEGITQLLTSWFVVAGAA